MSVSEEECCGLRAWAQCDKLVLGVSCSSARPGGASSFKVRKATTYLTVQEAVLCVDSMLAYGLAVRIAIGLLGDGGGAGVVLAQHERVGVDVVRGRHGSDGAWSVWCRYSRRRVALGRVASRCRLMKSSGFR